MKMRCVTSCATFSILSLLALIPISGAQAAYTGTQRNYVAESGSLSFTPPAGSKYTSVVFASYGTPNTSTYTTGGCHAANSSSTVAGYFIGRTTTTSISATNGVFGDPCSGTGKTLAIILAYTTIITNSTTPVISGTLALGQVLSTSNGTWNVTPDSYSYQWQSSATSNGTYTNIAGATSSSYTLTSSDVGKFLRVQVSATNDAGTVTTTSIASGSSVSAGTTTTLSITGSPTSSDYRSVRALVAGVSINGKVTFKANGVVISGCKNKLTTLLSYTCNWKPATRGYVNLVVSYTPTLAGYQSSVSSIYRIFISNRSGTR